MSLTKKEKEILAFVEEGKPLEVACALAMVDERAYVDAVEKDFDELDADERAFVLAYRRALAVYHERLIAELEGAPSSSWMKVAWILERRFPHIYARPDRKVAQDEGLKIEVVRDVPRPKGEEEAPRET